MSQWVKGMLGLSRAYFIALKVITVVLCLLRRFLSYIYGVFLDLLLPPVCLVCKRPVSERGGLCVLCWNELTFIERPYCDKLGVPFPYDIGDKAVSVEAMRKQFPYYRARAAVLYRGTALALVRGLKYRDRIYLAEYLGKLTFMAGKCLIVDADIVVPIPLHIRRFIWRRFNQSEMIARSVANSANLPLVLLALKRIKATVPQVGLCAQGRSDNVAGAFTVDKRYIGHILGKRIILVDDVVTTGATAIAATEVLLNFGALSVDLLTFAMAKGPRE